MLETMNLYDRIILKCLNAIVSESYPPHDAEDEVVAEFYNDYIEEKDKKKKKKMKEYMTRYIVRKKLPFYKELVNM